MAREGAAVLITTLVVILTSMLLLGVLCIWLTISGLARADIDPLSHIINDAVASAQVSPAVRLIPHELEQLHRHKHRHWSCRDNVAHCVPDFQDLTSAGSLELIYDHCTEIDDNIVENCSQQRYSNAHEINLSNNEAPVWFGPSIVDQQQHDALQRTLRAQVNVILELNKRFVIEYVSFGFRAPSGTLTRSITIYKQEHYGRDETWIPYRFYSDNCMNETTAPSSQSSTQCVQLNGTLNALTSLQHVLFVPSLVASRTSSQRPGWRSLLAIKGQQRDDYHDKDYWDYVSASGIRISLGVTIKKKQQQSSIDVSNGNDIRSHEYRADRNERFIITNFTVGGYCECNGHANECYATGVSRLGTPNDYKCRCLHGTGGNDCDHCDSMFRDRLWLRADKSSANECRECKCNGHANSCVYDAQLFEATGHGGRCVDCRDNTDGAHCEICRVSYYRNKVTGTCESCDCNADGTDSTQEQQSQQSPSSESNSLSSFFSSVLTTTRITTTTHMDSVTNPNGTTKVTKTVTSQTKSSGGGSCDQLTGQCRCKNNVTGRRCDQCAAGYYNFRAGCLKCDCDPLGSVNGTCDTALLALTLGAEVALDLLGDGGIISSSINQQQQQQQQQPQPFQKYQCKCKPGVTGVRCDKCEPLHYGFSATGCSKCDCDPVGSNATQCHETTGQCSCKANIVGRRCERCKDNMHDKSVGCVECDTCYKIVELGVEHHRKRLRELEDMVRAIENDPQIVKDADFERRLLELLSRATLMLRQAEGGQALESNLLVQLDQLAARVAKVLESAANIEHHLGAMRPMIEAGAANITLAESILKRIQDELNAARNHINTDGMLALEKARQRAQRLGQQSEQLTRIAKESRQLADSHELDAGKINETTRAALEMAESAYKLAKDAVATQEMNAKNVAALRAQIDKAVDLLARMRKMSAEANAEARKSYDEALALFTLINALRLHPVDALRLRQNATDTRDAALRLIKELEEFNSRHKQLLDSTQYKLNDLKALLAEARRQQQLTDAQLADVDRTIARARAAVEQGDRTLKEAQDTLATLKKFDSQVQESQKEALEALKKIPAIRKTIGDAENKTRDAAQKLDTALDDATDARDIAIEAFRVANETSNDARRIRADAQELRLKLAQLRALANELANEVPMKQYEEIAFADGQAAARALEAANQAAASAKNATHTAKNLLALLMPLLKNIDDIGGIDANKLAQLEDELNKVKQKFKDTDLTGKANQLMVLRDKQKQLMSEYRAMIDWLVKQVAQIKEIRDSLPEKCFRRLRLEPPMHEDN